MGAGLNGGTSFMEDYTYHLKNGGKVLEAGDDDAGSDVRFGARACNTRCTYFSI
jgi:L-arabinose isomerase